MSSEEVSISGVADAMDWDSKLMSAATNGMTHIRNIIPFLEYRAVTAKKYLHYSADPESKEALKQIILHCNKEISKLLGL